MVGSTLIQIFTVVLSKRFTLKGLKEQLKTCIQLQLTVYHFLGLDLGIVFMKLVFRFPYVMNFGKVLSMLVDMK